MSPKNKIVPHTVITRLKDLVSCDLDGETVLMSVQSGKYYGLDEIGSRIWALIEQPRSLSDVCDILIGEFDVERETCKEDVLEFVNKLVKSNLVEVVDEAAE
jgi:hypothetical protein